MERRYDRSAMLRKILVAFRDWAVRHVLRSKDERIGDYLFFDDILIESPLDRPRKKSKAVVRGDDR